MHELSHSEKSYIYWTSETEAPESFHQYKSILFNIWFRGISQEIFRAALPIHSSLWGWKRFQLKQYINHIDRWESFTNHSIRNDTLLPVRHCHDIFCDWSMFLSYSALIKLFVPSTHGNRQAIENRCRALVTLLLDKQTNTRCTRIRQRTDCYS